VVVPAEQRAEIAVLKGIVAAFVMVKNSRQPIYTQQREVLSALADRIYNDGPVHLEPAFRADWKESADDTARRRIVVDQVASLTDQSALAWFERLVVT
jgi:dGTPase